MSEQSIDDLLNNNQPTKQIKADTQNNDSIEIILAKTMELQKNQLDLLNEIKSNISLNSKSEHSNTELNQYKEDFLNMNIGSLNAIMQNASSILESINTSEAVRNNLTESWLQGKIAITEDYMRTIHDFVKYVPSEDDNISAEDKASLWENIRKKKEREGKNYKPAKPGDKDRPDPEAWKKAQK